MSSSLQEQLVQAGLADEESLNRSRQSGQRRAGGKRTGGKRAGGKKKGSGRKSRQSGQPAGDQANRSAVAPKTAERAKTETKPPSAPQREPSAEEKADRLRQMIRANRIDRAYAAVPYRFTQGARVREIAVTGTQQGRIARGELAVVSDGQRCELVPAKVARRVRGIDPAAVLVLNVGDERGGNTDEDPYADYRVPDDLMW
ncbi:DUF2058 domain-containing protein [Halofilum ochraceum]|uniref:DUF2058 domain-containing protein n=1 Tax=Halofilum ochraceum TaxID=1611323 RepID=UPI0008328024|nr:DUF2058 family protein [Halofilum ochraceum]